VGSEFEPVYRRAAADQVPATIMGYYPDHERWYDVNIFPAQNGITIYFKDVSERVLTDEVLRKSQDEADRQRRLYETILSSTADLTYVFDLDHRFTYANDILLKMWGMTWDEAIGKNCLELGYEPWHAEMHNREIDEVVATKRPIRGEVPFTGTFGRRIYDYIFVPVFGNDGEVEAVAGTTRDITDRQQMEENLREGDRRKDEFLATLAHELRNPLAPIRSGLEIIRRLGNDPAKFDETLEIIERQTNQIVHLVDDLLDISRITQGKIKLKKERIELETAIGIALESSRDLIDKAQNSLTVSFPHDPIYLDADLTRVAQIFLNILNNAAKYSDPGGRITLFAGREGGNAVVDIVDTGLGIEPEMLATIFDMFGQIASPDEEARGGLGIGLSVVKKLVEMHGGSVQAKSEGLGKGCIFTVCLPLAEVQSPALAVDSETIGPGETAEPRNGHHRESPVTTGRRILVVDDNHDALELLTLLLTIEGHTLRQASDGVSALEIARDFHPEICLCDIGLPGMNGYELATRLREMLPDSLLISISGWGREEDRRRSQDAGFNFHMVKPVQIEDILELIQTAS
jgi:PAS domain S-box-containing protein